MATFFLVPSRQSLGQHFSAFLAGVFPGLDWKRIAVRDLAEMLAALAGAQPEVYVIFREDLADEVDPEEALMTGFGAQLGDEIVEIPATELAPARWRVGLAA